ncbi:MAG: Gfo/Idh/MocA family oxidoreductase [Planctomycetota bacterium]|nr:Gfo/Idh/MocA family oxidoreductase [Planctomycetota bacterium]
MEAEEQKGISRRDFMQVAGGAGLAMGLAGVTGEEAGEDDLDLGLDDIPKDLEGNVIPGFEKTRKAEPKPKTKTAKGWQPVSDRKVRVGIAGYGLCRFGAQFSFQTHPNVEVVAVSDLDPNRCAGLAKVCRCKKTYPSCEEMVKDDNIEAVFIATDAPSHARLAVMALKHGKHVASAVPAVFGSNGLEEAELLFNAVKASGKKYMMFETTAFRPNCYASRQQYQAGALGKLVYSEGEYYHYMGAPLGSYNPKTGKVDGNGWRKGLAPMWYPTHSTGFYVAVSGGRLTEASCLGMPSIVGHLKADGNAYKNPFGTEVALLKTSEGGMSRMAVSWDMPGAHGETGRVFGQKNGNTPKVNTSKPPLPPRVSGGGHGGSHGYLSNDFIESILLNRKPVVDAGDALNMTLAGVIAHQSALKDGEWMKIPQYEL